jgi:glycosyltransferase involved in cell wall biosynthesis
MNQLTFIIPAYGESPYLRECINSLKSQTVSVDIVISTPTPNDYIYQIAKEAEISIVVNANHRSIAEDWNFALNIRTSCNLVVLAHQDDLYLNTFAENVLAFFTKNPSTGIIFTDSYELVNNQTVRYNKREYIKKTLRSIAFLGVNRIKSKIRYFLLLGMGCPIPCPSVVFNKKIIADFKFDNNYSVNLDWAAWSSLAYLMTSIGYIRKPLVIHRIHEKSQTQIAISDSRRIKEDLKMFAQYWPKPIAIVLCKIYQMGYQ